MYTVGKESGVCKKEFSRKLEGALTQTGKEIPGQL
jgi:hypothetical protein